MAKIFRRLNKGTNGRYKGKLPLICFNCDVLQENKAFNKSFCTKEDSSSSNEDEVSESETKRAIFMEVEDSGKEDTKE